MKTLVSSTMIGLALLLSGCSDQQARDYALKIHDILEDYQNQIKHNLDSEQLAYEKLAGIYVTEKHRDVFESLSSERISRTGALSAALVEGRIQASAVSEDLQKYASEDFDRVQKIYAEEMDAASSYEKALNSLTASAKKASDLSKILSELGKPPNLVQRGEALSSWAQEFQKEDSLQSCLQIQSAYNVA